MRSPGGTAHSESQGQCVKKVTAGAAVALQSHGCHGSHDIPTFGLDISKDISKHLLRHTSCKSNLPMVQKKIRFFLMSHLLSPSGLGSRVRL